MLAISALTNAGHASNSLCSAGETIFFSCKTRHERQVALCGGTNATISYRFGTPGRIELAYPTHQTQAPPFRYAHYFRAQTDRTEVVFANGKTGYTVFDYREGKRRTAGVRVMTEAGEERTKTCRGTITSRLPSLAEILPCDTDNALTLGACPASPQP